MPTGAQRDHSRTITDRMGRPPKGDKARPVVLSFRATEDERTEIRAASDLVGVELSELALRGTLREARRVLRQKGKKPVQ